MHTDAKGYLVRLHEMPRSTQLNCCSIRTSTQQPHQPAHITIRALDPLTWGQEVDRNILNSLLARRVQTLTFPSWPGLGLHPDRALIPTACLIRKKIRNLSSKKSEAAQEAQAAGSMGLQAVAYVKLNMFGT